MQNEISWKEYWELQIKDLRRRKYRHVLLLLYWPLYVFVFFLLEHVYPEGAYTSISCGLDSYIPFCEYFVIPYLLWFPFWIGTLVLAIRYNMDLFRRFMRYLIFGFTTALLIYCFFPNCQQLRPVSFPRENLCTWLVQVIYFIDTNTNVCPSEHVIAAVGTVFAVWHSRRFSKPIIAIPLTVLGIAICFSVVFIKQHSALDIAAALPICAIGYLISFSKLPGRRVLQKRMS